MIKRFEYYGFLIRVRAASQYECESQLGRYHDCVKLIRMPNAQEIKVAWGPMSNQGRGFSFDDASLGADIDSDEEEDRNKRDHVPIPDEPSGSVSGEGVISTDPQPLHEIETPVPQWSPKQMWADMLFKVINAAGTEGISTMVSFIRMAILVLT